jgi:glycosyltransferase involved in cell wall biosynthesis
MPLSLLEVFLDMRAWVVQVGEPVSFVDGGIRPFQTEMLVNRLVERGHDVLFWSSTFDHLQKRFRFFEERNVALGSRLRYHFLHGSTAYRKNISFGRCRHDLELAEAFLRAASEEAVPDLILCSVPPLRLARRVAEYAHAHGIPFILDVRDTWPDSLLKNLKFPFLQLARWIFRRDLRRTRQIFHRANGITAISIDCLRWGLKRADRRSSRWDKVFPLAYEEPPKTIFHSSGERVAFLRSIRAENAEAVVTCIGRVGSSFDFDLVMQLAKEYGKDSQRRVQFVLAGDGPIQRLLRKKFKELPNLTITGWLDQGELQRILAVTTVGLLPYRPIHCSSIRNKPLDFLAMGIPMVSSLCGDLAELMDRHGFGLPFRSGDGAALHACLEQLLHSPQLRKKMGENGLNVFQEHFTADRICGSFADYLEEFQREQSRCRLP